MGTPRSQDFRQCSGGGNAVGEVYQRSLRDKAIDLVDEAAARLKMEITSKPEELDEIDRKILQMEMERLSLQKKATPLPENGWNEWKRTRRS